MPIYEFKCNTCGRRFETLCRMSEENGVACPSCKGKKVSRLVSSFFSSGSGGGCAGCGSGKCASCRS